MKRLSILFAHLLLIAFSLSAQINAPEKQGTLVTFTFAPGKDVFILQSNEAELARLYRLIDEYRSEITAGRMPLYVDGYCASLPTAKENLDVAFVRANRVKSELITHKSLKEADFITKNFSTAWQGHKDMVVVALRIPAKETVKQAESATLQPRKEEQAVVVERHPEPKEEMQTEPAATVETEQAVLPKATIPGRPYTLAVRTNLLYDAMLLPTIGVEWRVNSNLGIKLDGSLSWWGGNTGKVQKMWLLNPEVRWYLLDSKRFYAGVSGSYGEYNIYKYPLGNLLKDDTGYQGTLWNVGLTVGYQLCLSRQFSVDFNLGLGYTRSEYDSFGMTDKVRVYKERGKTKNFWGPTQAGISLVWTIGGHK